MPGATTQEWFWGIWREKSIVQVQLPVRYKETRSNKLTGILPRLLILLISL